MRRIGPVLVLFCVIAGITIALVFLSEGKTDSAVPGSGTDEERRSRYNVTEIDGTHTFAEGTHRVTGEVTMPTPCDVLESTVRVAESYPEQATIIFDVRSEPEGMCVQVLSPQSFEVSFEASREAQITAEFIGEPIPLNLIETMP